MCILYYTIFKNILYTVYCTLGNSCDESGERVVESLRWSSHCSDQEEEKKRIEEYKEKRRQRYLVAIEERRTTVVAQKIMSQPSNPFYYVLKSQVT